MNKFSLSTLPLSIAGPLYTIPISQHEEEQASELRKYFESISRQLDEFSEFLNVFFTSLDDLDANTTNLQSLSALLVKYRTKLKNKFNAFIDGFSSALGFYQDSVVDTKFDAIRDLLIENVKTMRASLIDLLKEFKNIESKNFVKKAKDIYMQIQKDVEQIQMMIRKEMFGHIDRDYLGKIRLT